MVRSSTLEKATKVLAIGFFIAMMAFVIYFMVTTVSGFKDDDWNMDQTFDIIWYPMYLTAAFMVIMIVLQIATAIVRSREIAYDAPAAPPGPMDYERKDNCTQCGSYLGDDNPKHCPECGHRVKKDFYHR